MKYLALVNHLLKSLAILSVCAMSISVQAQDITDSTGDTTGTTADATDTTGGTTDTTADATDTTGGTTGTTGDTTGGTTGTTVGPGSDIAERCVFIDKIHFTAKKNGSSGEKHFDVKVLDDFNELADLEEKVWTKLGEICGNNSTGITGGSTDAHCGIEENSIKIKNVALAVDCENGANQTGTP